jgi:hypothetical protein
MNQLTPNFFIIGAPKCGTTSLSIYLAEHPNVVMSLPKEPHYFSTDIENGRITDQSKYLACFSANQNSSAIGDASTLYLYSKVAINNILAFNKDAKFIVMLRNPTEVAFSFHQLALKIFSETETNFEKAWYLQTERAIGNHVPKGCPDLKLLLYGEIAKFGFQVDRLLSKVNRHKVHFIYFDDFINKTDKIIQSVFNFLELTPNLQIDYQIHNKTKRIQYPQFTKMVNIALGVKKSLGIKSEFGIAARIHKKNITDGTPNQLNLSTLRMLADYFEKDIQTLSTLLNKDFSNWSLNK